MSEDDSALRWCKLNKNTFKNYLADRYGKKVSDRMLNYLESTFGNFFRIDFQTYLKYLKDFLKLGQKAWINFAFQAFNITANGKICEHDMF